MATLSFEVKVSDDKYHLRFYDDGTSEAFRHGEPWPAMTQSMLGSKIIHSLALELSIARVAEDVVAMLDANDVDTEDSEVEQLRDDYHSKLREWFGDE